MSKKGETKDKPERPVPPESPVPPLQDTAEAEQAMPEQPPEIVATDADEAEALRSELNALKDEMLRQRADFDNARKRIEKQKRDDIKYSSLPLIRELLTVIDHLELALNHAEEDDPLRQGVNMALGEMKKALKNHHLEQIESVGKKFDPSIHEALSVVHDPEKSDNIIIDEQHVGYKMFDRVVRPSRVIVNKHPAVKTEETLR